MNVPPAQYPITANIELVPDGVRGLASPFQASRLWKSGKETLNPLQIVVLPTNPTGEFMPQAFTGRSEPLVAGVAQKIANITPETPNGLKIGAQFGGEFVEDHE
jgi:hypothetical protein